MHKPSHPFLALLWMIGIVAITGGTQLEAAPTDISNPFNLLTQPRLGDCITCRPAVETQGVVLSAQSISDLLGNTTGGESLGTTYSGLLNLGLAVDLQKAIGWEGASFKSSWLWLYGNNLSSQYIGNALTVSSVAGYPAFRAGELWLQQNFFHDAISLRGGWVSLDTEFMSSDTAALFVNSAFGADFFTGNMPNGGPAYPMSLPGLRLAWQPTSWLTLRSALTQANPFAQNVNRTGLNWDFSSSGGLLSMNEIAASWNKDPQSKGLSGTVKAGFWMQNSQAVIAQGISTSASTSGFYGILDQQLYVVPNKVLPFLTSAPEGKNPPSPPDASCTCPSKGLSSFARIEFSPQQGSPVGLYSDAGLVYTGLLPTRDADKLGVALGYAQMGSQVASLTRATGAPGVGYEAVAELSYAMQMTPAISIQPDLQLILHPGGTQQYGNALVLGVRAVVNF